MSTYSRKGNTVLHGPWLFNRQSLEELDRLVEKIENILEVDRRKAINKKIVAEGGAKISEDPKEVLILPDKMHWYEEKREEKVITLEFKEKVYLTDTSILSVLGDTHLEHMTPNKMIILIDRGIYTVEIQIDCEDNTIKIMAPKLVHESYTMIISDIAKWQREYKQSTIFVLWSKWFCTLGFTVFIVLMLFLFWLLFYLSADRNGSHALVTDLVRKSDSLLVGGLESVEIPHAVEILLANQNLALKKSYPAIDLGSALFSRSFLVYLFIALFLIILSLKPKTILGIGKGEQMLKRWKFITKLLAIFISIDCVFFLLSIFIK